MGCRPLRGGLSCRAAQHVYVLNRWPPALAAASEPSQKSVVGEEAWAEVVVMAAGYVAAREAWVHHGPSAAPQMRVEQSPLSKWGGLGLCSSNGPVL